LKCTLVTFIVSRCGFLRCLHRGVAAIAGGKARGLLHQGPTLLLAQRPQWLASGRGSSRHAWARRCSRRQAKRVAEHKRWQETAGRRGGAGAARGDRRQRSGPQSRSSRATDRVGVGGVAVDVRRKAEQVSRLLLFLSNRRDGIDERCADIYRSKE
jgi:hypothetical protein